MVTVPMQPAMTVAGTNPLVSRIEMTFDTIVGVPLHLAFREGTGHH